jgi:plastocyanin/mono/diheme cytochrome c family protein
MRASFLSGAFLVVAVGAVIGAAVVWSGVIDVSALNAGGPQDRVLAYASTRSLARHAPRQKNPRANDPAAIKDGLGHYRAMCLTCHGGPGAEPAEFAAGLHPAPPDLGSPQIQAFTDGMLYQAISGGIGSTGMPGFAPARTPEQIWDIVAFVRHLPALTAEEKKLLGEKAPGEGGEMSATPAAAAAPDAGATAAVPEGKGGQAHTVSISGFKFDPPSLEVKQGDSVIWKNDDFVAHTATADDKSFDTGRIDAGEIKRIVASKKGTFPYFCRYHLAMRGTLTVK